MNTRKALLMYAVVTIFLICNFNTYAKADDVQPINISIIFNKVQVNINESLQATYTITGGSGTYSRISYVWQEYSGETWISGTQVNTTSSSATISYTPTKGSQVRLYVYATDSDGRTKTLFSDSIPVIGAPVIQPLNISIIFNKAQVNINESLQATYTITGGSGTYNRISYVWQEYSGETWISGTQANTTSSSATISYTPTKGSQVRLYVYATDSDGRTKTLFSDSIPVIPQQLIFSNQPASIQTGQSFTISPYISDGTHENFTYTSSNTSVATVNSAGTVKGISAGSVEITVKGVQTGLVKTMRLSVVTPATTKLSASLSGPSYIVSSSTVLSFNAQVTGGTKPYSYAYTLYRDGNSVYTSTSSSSTFEAAQTYFSGNGTYTGKVVVTDSAGQYTIAWSDGYYQSYYSGFGIGTFGMGPADFRVPSGTKRIEVGAFESIRAQGVYIPDSCTSIGSRAFANCRSLTKIRIPRNCTVSADAFAGCSGFYIFGAKGSPAEEYAIAHDGQCVFIAE